MKKFALHAFPCFVLDCNVEICRYFVEFSFRYQQKHESYFEFIIIHTANLHKISFYPLTKDFLSRKLPNPRNLSHFRKQTRRRKITFPRGGIFSRQSDTIRVCIRMLEERERETRENETNKGRRREKSERRIYQPTARWILVIRLRPDLHREETTKRSFRGHSACSFNIFRA